MGPKVDLASLPPGVLVALVALAAAEVGLDAIALISLARRPQAAVAFGNKWAWLAIILVINPIGAIVYLAVGRTAVAPTPRVETAASPTSIADALYGKRDPGDTG